MFFRLVLAAPAILFSMALGGSLPLPSGSFDGGTGGAGSLGIQGGGALVVVLVACVGDAPAKTPAVKRVRRAAPPAGGDAKGE